MEAGHLPQPEGLGKDAAKDNDPARLRLYNLDREIGERTNLAEQHPDVVAKLQALAAKMNAEIGGSKPRARRPAGEVNAPQTLYPMEPTESARPATGGWASCSSTTPCSGT